MANIEVEVKGLTKSCTGCKKELPATTEYFNKQKIGLYGLSNICKSCKSKQNKEYREKNKEYYQEYAKEYWKKYKKKDKEEKEVLEINLGVMADDLIYQIESQGYTLSDKNNSKYNKIKNSMHMLHFHNYITDSQKYTMIKKFMDDLINDLEQLPVAKTSMQIKR